MNEKFIKFYEGVKRYCLQNSIVLQLDNDGEFYFNRVSNSIHLGESEEKMTLSGVYKMFHECCHSTSIITNREVKNYALEEVVADLAAAKILSELGFYDFKNGGVTQIVQEAYRLAWLNLSYSSCWLSQILNSNKGKYTTQDILNKIRDELEKIFIILTKEQI